MTKVFFGRLGIVTGKWLLPHAGHFGHSVFFGAGPVTFYWHPKP